MSVGATVTALVTHWGLPLVVVLAFAEGDSLAMIVGAMVHRDILPLTGTLAAVWLGAFASDQLWFHIGRRAGRWDWAARQMERPGVKRLRARIERSETPLMLGFRFLYGTRIPVPLLLGHGGASAVKFVLVDAVAVLVWAAGLMGIGAGLGAAVHALFGRLPPLPHYALVFLGGLVVLAFAALLTRHIRRKGRR